MHRQANRLRYGPDTHRNKPNHWHHSIASTLHPSETKKYLIFGFVFYFLFIMYKSQFFWNFNFYIGSYAWQPWNWQASHLDQQHHRHLQRWLKAKTSALSTFNSSILKAQNIAIYSTKKSINIRQTIAADITSINNQSCQYSTILPDTNVCLSVKYI